MLQGDIANFAPADLLVFLAHLNKEGVLTVRTDAGSLNLSFQRGLLVDVQSEAADARVLAMLRQRDIVPPALLDDVARAVQETELPLWQVLESLADARADDLGPVLAAGAREAVFQLFLWERGEFQLAEIPVEANPYLPSLDSQALTFDVTRQIDEYRETLRRLGSLDRAILVTPAGRDAQPGNVAVRYLLDHANGQATVRELVAHAPLPTADIMAALGEAISAGWIQGVASAAPMPQATPDSDSHFAAFRRTLRSLLRAVDTQAKIRELAGYCRDHFGCTLLLGTREGTVVRCLSYRRDARHGLTTQDRKNLAVPLDLDSILLRACESQLPFIGRVFASPLLESLGVAPPAGDCAVVPLGEIDGLRLLLYAAAGPTPDGPGPLRYLELLSWHVLAPMAEEPVAVPTTAPAVAPVVAEGDAVDRMVGAIKDLPPMPAVVARILHLLSDPECSIADLTSTLSQDPALVARLIKVSNSSLYGSAQKAGSVNQAIVRLGMRSTRSLVIAVSTRALFPMDNPRIGLHARALWDHSVASGIAARHVAAAAGYADPDEAFVAGVLHDIGKVIFLLNVPDDALKALRLQESARIGSVAAEMRVLGFDHTEVGARLLQKWDLPPELIASTRWHHDPHAAGDFLRLACITACANALGRRDGAGTVAEASLIGDILARHAPELGLAPARLPAIQEQLVADLSDREQFA